MGSSNSVERPPRNPVPEGKTRVCVAGFKVSPYTGNARATAAAITAALPDNYETWFYFDTRDNYYAFLKETFDSVTFPPHLKGHDSSPFVWLERGATNEITPIGGNSHLSEWVLAQPDLVAVESIKKLAAGSGLWGPTFHNGASAPQPTADITPTTPAVADATDAKPTEASTEDTTAAAKKAEEEAAAAKKAEEEAAAAKKAEEEAAAAKKAEEEAAAAKKAEEEAAAAKKAEEEAAAAKKAEEEAAAAKKAEEEAADAKKAEEEAAAAKKAEEEAAAATKKAEEEPAAAEETTADA